ncbi:hypothetical protein H6P81_003210 [Aristolochia fimbriata]|uniref:Hyccin n=1 Tax=Aristolochia fimbriata TaxID=158543 RepID=A0AAV7FG51_ARIFI|nr:hypothetical protein H6P81_003210 [Aristolochia fimbriata]
MSVPGSPQSPSPESTAATVPARQISHSKLQLVFDSLAVLLDSLPDSISNSDDPSRSLLHDQAVADQITARLRQPLSGAGDDNLCRWLYDTFHAPDPALQLVVLRFLPTLCGVYLLRAVARKPLPGFEAVLLALYAHETKSRNGQAVTVTIPDVAHPSLYHETTRTVTAGKNAATAAATELHIAVVSPSLEPHGTVRATKRARIVGVALELYYSKISLMPVSSKLEFCRFCRLWAGDYDTSGGKLAGNGEDNKGGETREKTREKTGEEIGEKTGEETGEKTREETGEKTREETGEKTREETGGKAREKTGEEIGEKIGDETGDETGEKAGEKTGEETKERAGMKTGEEKEERGGRIPLPWELLQPSLRILGHCVMGSMHPRWLKAEATAAIRSVHGRAVHEMHPQSILATQSLMKSAERVVEDPVEEVNARYGTGVDTEGRIVLNTTPGAEVGAAAAG